MTGVCVAGGAESVDGKCGVWGVEVGKFGWVESVLFSSRISGFAEVGHPRSTSRFCGARMFGVHREEDFDGRCWGWWDVLLSESAGSL